MNLVFLAFLQPQKNPNVVLLPFFIMQPDILTPYGWRCCKDPQPNPQHLVIQLQLH